MFYMHYYEFLNGLIKLKLLVFCKHSVFNGFIIIEDLLSVLSVWFHFRFKRTGWSWLKGS